ncbi:hypothetical protein QQS21_008138 [Conoideocrella luteorostrata]|uniref:Rhodopsin domain-containing protein n=1 Tax=Conoideocrella luteorostrata TaxID=1105319 RepID=A0AAJ0CM41_9HYPO|nr:hypothetical protein QQS21_008138 [Conoideocrella luteorostrata]
MSLDGMSHLPGLPGYDPDNLQPWTVAVVVSMTLLALVAVGLRLLSRRMKHQSLWLDDKMIGWNLIVVGFIFAMYSSGMGIHADQVDAADIVMMAKWLVVAEVLYAWNLGWTKVSLLLMYYRIFRHEYFKKLAWAIGAFVWAWVICITFLFIFICVPVQKLWYPQIPGRCINQVGTWIANAASTILTDLVILLMPIPQIWKLQLRKTEKIGLTFAFSLGFFVVFASAYRTSVLFTYSNTDPTYTLAPTVGWTAIEMSAGIVSACLPTLLPIVLRCAQAFGFTRTASAPSRDTFAPPTFGGSGGHKTKIKSGTNTLSTFSTRVDDEDGDKCVDSPFYRLPDSTESDSLASHRMDARNLTPEDPLETALRPDIHEYGHSAKSYTVKGNGNDDDIPLQGIRVQKDFKKSTSRKL